MPHPANLNTALSLEHIIRQTSHNTVIPATIALLHGRIHIGLTHPELTRLSDPEVSRSSIKVSKRDLAVAVERRLDGGTTVAGTMALANEVGIEVFVTGGIGGVHRGAQSSKSGPSLPLLLETESRRPFVCLSHPEWTTRYGHLSRPPTTK